MPFSRRRSLTIKLPLLLSLLLLAAVAAMAAASYIELRGALTQMAGTRLHQAAAQMANVFAMSSRQRVAAMKQLMARADVRDFLATRNPAQTASIDEAIRAYLGTALPVANVELWDRDGHRLFEAGATFEETPASLVEEYKRDLPLIDDASIGRLRMFEDGLRYPVGGGISQNGQVIGYVVERRRINNPSQTRQTVQLLTGLIGNEATMVLGNADGTVWSDLEKPIADVPIRADENRLWDYTRAGRPRTFAWATAIDGTPWAVAIEFPQDAVLEPSQRLVVRLVGLALLLFGVSVAVGWVLTRRITTPLAQVTEAAESVADMRPHVHVEIDREDEIGRLADSFNIMAARVEQSRIDLEARVEQRTAELQAANRELESFSYSVSHDLRAPLRAIAGFVQILDEDHGAQLDAQARKHLERVRVNAQRMGQLIDDLLSFSRIGRTAMSWQTVDLTSMATAIAEEAVAASGRPIALTIDPLPACHGEPSLLNQVIVNLISNAVKFTSKVPEPSIHVGSTSQNGETIYFVRDNGVGFDERYAEKLFGVFQRLHRVVDFEGTGVGLAIVHRIISRHGGRVWAEGKLNEGATFYFTLPSPARASEGKPSAA